MARKKAAKKADPGRSDEGAKPAKRAREGAGTKEAGPRSLAERLGGMWRWSALVAGLVVLNVGFCQLWRHEDGQAPSGGPEGPRPSTTGKNARAYVQGANADELTIGALGARKFRIIDVHEHLQTERDAKLLIDAMDDLGVQRSCLQASSYYTFTLSNKYGFERFKENNEKLIELKGKYPGRFCAFVTLHPPDDGNLELLQKYVGMGADGLKLYLGHGASHGKGPFHMMPLDDERMRPIYAYAQKIQLPITFHINLIEYFDELVNVMEMFPYLRVNIPHFGLHKNTERRLNRLSWLLERYPNMYTDVSFGWRDFHLQGFESLSANRERSRVWLARHQHKVLFASDLVIEKMKTPKDVDEVMRSYMQLLENDKLRFFLAPKQVMHGLALPAEVLRNIYEVAPARFLLLDDAGKLRDRAAGWPTAEDTVPGLPPAVPKVPQPLDRATIPPK